MEKKYTVLYIDDNDDNRTLVERFLGYEGFEVYSANTAQSGLAQAAEIIPDIFLIDLHLPDMSGYDVVDVLNNRCETQHIPKIIFSANDVQLTEKKAGFDYFIQKPLDINTLAEKLEYAIQHPANNTGRQL
ncbi:MAG: response regulator [Desulfobacteraceae bacterium]|nr:MAG: response regulator [Desulfobacteraceae bacterium]